MSHFKKIEGSFMFIAMSMLMLICQLPDDVHADKLCTIAYGPGGYVRCSDNGCAKVSKQCYAVDTDGNNFTDDCECKKSSLKNIGVRAEADAGIVMFDGSSLTISGMTISNIHHITGVIDDPADVVVGATVTIPEMTYQVLITAIK